MKKDRRRRIIKVAQQLKSNVEVQERYRKLNEKLGKKIEHLILSKMKSNRIERSSQILEKYKKYCDNLLKTN